MGRGGSPGRGSSDEPPGAGCYSPLACPEHQLGTRVPGQALLRCGGSTQRRADSEFQDLDVEPMFLLFHPFP